MSQYNPQPFQQPGFAPPGYQPPRGPYVPGGPGTPAPKKQFSMFVAPFLFWSPALWRDVGRNWRGIGAWYLIWLLALTWLPCFLKFRGAYADFVRDDAPKFLEQIPAITNTNGVATMDRPSPYYIRDPDAGQAIAVFDTSGRTTALPEGAVFLLTKNSILTREASGVTRTIPLSQLPSGTFDKNTVRGWLDSIASGLMPVFYPASVLLSFIKNLIWLLIFGALGLAFSAGFGAKLSYGSLMRLTAISLTPYILLDTVAWIMNWEFGCAWYAIGWLMTLGVLALAVRANVPAGGTPGGYPAGGTTYPPQPYAPSPYPQAPYPQPGWQQPQPPPQAWPQQPPPQQWPPPGTR